jgi:hypothetical protein
LTGQTLLLAEQVSFNFKKERVCGLGINTNKNTVSVELLLSKPL